MKKTYTFDDFRINDYAFKTITASGYVSSYTGKYDVNTSSILTRLIQEAGRFCEHYASDLFIDWEAIQRTIDKGYPGMNETYLLGFRECGVDGNTYIFSRYNNYGDSARHEYRSLWRLDIECSCGDPMSVYPMIKLTLGRVF